MMIIAIIAKNPLQHKNERTYPMLYIVFTAVIWITSFHNGTNSSATRISGLNVDSASVTIVTRSIAEVYDIILNLALIKLII